MCVKYKLVFFSLSHRQCENHCRDELRLVRLSPEGEKNPGAAELLWSRPCCTPLGLRIVSVR